MKRILFSSLVLLLMAACSKRPPLPEPNPPIGPVPQITLDKVSDYNVKALEDPLVFTIGYLDGDGDIGFESADSTTIYLTDNRVPLIHEFAVQPLAPIGANIAIQGALKVTLDNTIMTDVNASSEVVTFTVRLRDRAGNWSNEVTSAPVTVNK